MSGVSFTGIPLAALDFYEDLEADNSKAFWTAHKTGYDDHVKAPITALADALAKDFGDYKYFRPYRDVRFSKDKTPYKTHQGVWFGESRAYLHVSAAGLFVASGYWHMSSGQVVAPAPRCRRRRRRPAAGEGGRGRPPQGVPGRRRAADPRPVRLRQGPPAGGPAAAQEPHRVA